MRTSLGDCSPSTHKCKTIAALVWVLAVMALGVACVETAECDETVSCPTGQACYELKCLPTCASNASCSKGSCVPCQEELPGGVIDHCFNDTAKVCQEE